MEQSRTLGSVFVDNLDRFAQFAILDRFGESSSERNEGAGELANPQVVPQPVTPSTTPGGQPNHPTPPTNNTLTIALIAGGAVVVLVMGIVIARAL